MLSVKCIENKLNKIYSTAALIGREVKFYLIAWKHGKLRTKT